LASVDNRHSIFRIAADDKSVQEGHMTATRSSEVPLLRVSGLNKWYGRPPSALARRLKRPSRRLRALHDVDLRVRRGETVAVVGETGSGKSTLGRLIVRLEAPSSGSIEVEGNSVLAVGRAESQRLRRKVQIILQDPYSTLNPYRSVAAAIGEVLKVHGTPTRAEREAETNRLLELVGFPVSMRDRMPGQLSGGGRQRASIARALAVRPELVVADEPVSALDVSVQAQVLNLFEQLRDELGLAYVFITHDIAVVRRLADRIAVMYLGRIVEEGPADRVLSHPLHPYTSALLAAAPDLEARKGTAAATPALTGDMPNPIDPPNGCVFHPRCPAVMDICRTTEPLTTIPDADHRVACHLHPGPAPSRDHANAKGDVTI
jgi:oligopeptide/dipeptide ABC transporter ATP-binding protein